MKPDDKLLTRITNRWTELGFQGHDPATDFRGCKVVNNIYFYNLVLYSYIIILNLCL